MQAWQKRSLDLVLNLANTSKQNPSVVSYKPTKLRISAPEKPYFKRSSPEAHGLSSRRLSSMLCELECAPGVTINNIMVIKDKDVVCECSRPGYDLRLWHLSHSMSKTITGMLVGLLIDDGVLDFNTRLVDIFPNIRYKDRRFKNITVEHLISMTAGVEFAELGSVTENNWLRAFFESSMYFEPGTAFSYNSMNSYVLARIVKKLTGSVKTLLEERIFRPLHITNYFWEESPDGTEKGGWGVYLSPESWAKLGYMVLSGGIFEGRRILSQSFVQKMISRHAKVPDASIDFDYGYHLWVGRQSDEFLFNGMLGQNVWVCPTNKVIVVINSGNSELFQSTPTLSIIRKYLGGNIRDIRRHGQEKLLRESEKEFFQSRAWANPLPTRRGIAAWLGLAPKRPFDEAWDVILNKTYGFRRNHVGLLPLFVRCMQNNLNTEIESIRLERLGDGLYMRLREGGVDFKLEVGIYEHKYSVLHFRGEKYMVGVLGEALTDKDRHPSFKIEVIFPELPNTRRIRLTVIDDERILVRFSETPDAALARSLIDSFPTMNPRLAFAVDLLESRIDDHFITSRLESVFVPSFIAADMASASYKAYMEEEERRAEESSRSFRTIASILEKLTRKFDVDDVNEDKEKTGSFIASRIDKIKKRLKGASGDELARKVDEALE